MTTAAPTTILADLMPDTPTFLDNLTPKSGLALRRWNTDEYYCLARYGILKPDELRHFEAR